jgi:peroxiredoxin
MRGGCNGDLDPGTTAPDQKMTTTVEIPTSVVFAQWALLFGLSALVIILYRQLAYLLRTHSGGSVAEALSVGERAPSFEYQRLRNGVGSRFNPVDSTLLVFADPFCAGCVTALRTLNAESKELAKQNVSVVVATTADREQTDAVEEFNSAAFDLIQVSREVPTKLYGAAFTPFMFAIDRTGVVRGRGIAALRKEVKGLLRELDRTSEAKLSETTLAVALTTGTIGKPVEKTRFGGEDACLRSTRSASEFGCRARSAAAQSPPVALSRSEGRSRERCGNVCRRRLRPTGIRS